MRLARARELAVGRIRLAGEGSSGGNRMTFLKSKTVQAVLFAAIAGGTFVATAAPASAEVVCNRWHECWRVNDHYNYPRALGVVVRDEAWIAHHRGYRMRAHHEGRGYWRNGRWHGW
jgi:hypothetical protein